MTQPIRQSVLDAILAGLDAEASGTLTPHCATCEEPCEVRVVVSRGEQLGVGERSACCDGGIYFE